MSDNAVIERQRVQYFGTPLGFTQTLKMRQLRRLTGVAHAEWINGWYVHMRDLAKQSTTFGSFATDVESFVESYGGHVPHRKQPEFAGWFSHCVWTWECFAQVRLIALDPWTPGEVLPEPGTTFRVTVRDFAETNIARRVTSRGRDRDIEPMDDAERQAKRRENKKRRDAGLPEMSDAEANQWLMSRRVTSQGVTSRHVTRIGQDGIGDIQESSPDGEDRARAHEDAAPRRHLSAVDVTAPSPEERAAKEIHKCRRQLGVLAMAVDELASIAAQRKGITKLLNVAAVDELYRPAALLIPEWGMDVVGDALAVAVRKKAPNAKFLRSACEIAAKDRKPAAAAAPVDDERAAALDRSDLPEESPVA